MLYSEVGTAELQDGEIHIVTNVGDSGCVVFGPYCTLEPGGYEVVFQAMPRELSGETCCVVDVLRRSRSIVAEKDFTADELARRNGRIAVRFEVIERDVFEFRLTATGRAALTVRYQRPVRLLPAPPDHPDMQG